jgi:hypothetical protein
MWAGWFSVSLELMATIRTPFGAYLRAKAIMRSSLPIT